MSGDTDDIEFGDGRPAQIDAEEVWTALTSQFEKLKGDVICVVPETKLKNEIKKKFKSHEAPLRQTLASKVGELLKTREAEPTRESGRRLVEVNTRDLRENLTAEWVESMEALVQLAKENREKSEFTELLDGRLDFLSRKVQSSIDGFEGDFAHRFQQQAGTRVFGPMDFNRESLEADPLVPTSLDPSVPLSEYEKLESQMDSLRREFRDVRDESADKTKRIVELNEKLVLCKSLSTVLGCHPSDLEKETHKLFTMTAVQKSKIDALQKQLSDVDSFQDHAVCDRRINDLEADLDQKDTALDAQLQRVKLLSETIKDLRDELDKKSIRQSLNGSSDDGGTSADSASTILISSEFMDFQRRYATSSSETCVRDLGNYLTSAPLREYKSILHDTHGISFSELRDALRLKLGDNADLAKSKRRQEVASMLIQNGQSYSEFISVLESSAFEAFGEEANSDSVFRLKHDSLRNSIRETNLLMQLEIALESVPSIVKKYDDLKRMVLTYEQKSQSVEKFQQHGPLSNVPHGLSGQAAQSSAPKGHAFNPGNSNFVPLPATTKFGSRQPTICKFCNRMGHPTEKCWDKNPSLKPPKFGPSSTVAHTGGTIVVHSVTDASPPVPATTGVTFCQSLTASGKALSKEFEDVVGPSAVAPISFNGHKVDAVFDSGSNVNMVSAPLYKSLFASSNKAQRKCFELPAYPGTQSGIVVRDAQGKVMQFKGRVVCDVRASGNERKAEHYEFLVVENAPFDVVLVTKSRRTSGRQGHHGRRGSVRFLSLSVAQSVGLQRNVPAELPSSEHSALNIVCSCRWQEFVVLFVDVMKYVTSECVQMRPVVLRSPAPLPSLCDTSIDAWLCDAPNANQCVAHSILQEVRRHKSGSTPARGAPFKRGRGGGRSIDSSSNTAKTRTLSPLIHRDPTFHWLLSLC